MRAKLKTAILFGAVALFTGAIPAEQLSAQQTAASDNKEKSQGQDDPLAALSAENRALFEAMRQASQKGSNADVLANCKKLLPALKPDTPLTNFVTQRGAEAALEVGETSYALTVLKPLAVTHPDDWRVGALLARIYAESGEKALRDQQIAHMLDLHKQTTDDYFAKLHIFPIQKVKLRSGYAVFLYPFAPLGKHNSYLIASVYTNENKEDYRIELESDDVDQAFFKPKKPGDRRFSIDTYHDTDANGKPTYSQALHGFADGVFDYDRMRDLMVKTANGEELPKK